MNHLLNTLWNRTALACSAAFLALLLAFQVILIPAARAESVQGNGGVSQATVRNGYGQVFSAPQSLWVIDDRSEMLFIYTIENVGDTRMQFRKAVSLPMLFQQARPR